MASSSKLLSAMVARPHMRLLSNIDGPPAARFITLRPKGLCERRMNKAVVQKTS